MHDIKSDASTGSESLRQFRSSLTSKESLIVDRLVRANGDIVSREDLTSLLSGLAPRTLDTYIKQIRAKLRQSGLEANSLVTHVGRGFSLSLQ